MHLSPIVLFAYNRPDHLLNTLNSLKENDLADQSALYIFCDGPKGNATIEQLDNIEQVRIVAKSDQWCKEVNIIERIENLGLARSIITGVTEIINKYGRVVVLEDDIVTTPGFLTYMNQALDIYQDEPKVMHVAGYFYPLNLNVKSDTFFLPLGTCWGWATWKESWKKFNHSSENLLEQIMTLPKKEQNRFDFQNNSLRLLRKTALGERESWAIRWYASIFLAQGLGLHPKLSLVENIGFDGSGSNYFSYTKKNTTLTNKLNIDKIQITNLELVEKSLRSYFLWQRITSAPFYYLNKLMCIN